MPWRSEITVWQPERIFTYQQRRGPYRRWIHEHYFEDSEAGTRVVDRVDFATHLSFLMDSWVARDVARIFEHRVGVLEEVFGKIDGVETISKSW